MIAVILQPDDLIQMRFAYSPLIELSMSYRLLRGEKLVAAYAAWMEEVQQTLRGVAFPHMDALILPKSYVADFLTPTPRSPQFNLEAELQRMRETPEHIIRKDVQTTVEMDGPNEIRTQFLDYPREMMECLIDELRLYWNQVLAHHWSRIQSVLEGDVIFRARQFALEGVDALFENLGADMAYTQGQLQFKKSKWGCDLEFEPKGRGIQLVPTIFSYGGHISWQLNADWHPMLIYDARGAGLWYQENPPTASESLEIMLGPGRARVLQALVNPLNTSELAHKLNVTAGAISQHLARLNDAGLVESHRSGNRVYYRLTYRGERLLDIFAE